MSAKGEGYDALSKVSMDAKYAILMEDYVEIQHDYAEFKDRLQAANMKKAYLLAEVRFLRRRLKKLKEMPSDLKENQTVQATSLTALPNFDGKTYSQAPVPASSLLSAKNDWSSMFLDPLRRHSAESLKPIIDNFKLLSSRKTSSLSNICNPNLTEPAKKRKPSLLSKTLNPNIRAPAKNRKPSSLSNPPNTNITTATKIRKPSSFRKTPDSNLKAPTLKKESIFMQ